jgi:tRNA(Ile)-lysidine synthase
MQSIGLKINISRDKKILVAFSGGVDSVVLSYLLHKQGFNIALAHCNFGLRGKESDDDAIFCKQWSEKLKVEYYQSDFNTLQIAQQQKKSIQIVARSLRYDFFKQICNQYQYDYIVTAHHLNDDMETSLFNWCNANVLSGSTGIPYQRDNIIRPLLHVSKDEIYAFASNNSLQYREDSSNSSTKYSRNKIRLNVIPVLKEINPSVEQTFSQFKEINVLVYNYINSNYQDWMTSFGEKMFISFEKVEVYQLFIWKWMSENGFTWQNFQQLLQVCSRKTSSKKFLSMEGKQVWTSYKGVHFYPIVQKEIQLEISKKNIIPQQIPQQFSVPLSDVYVDASLISQDVYIRFWQQGDFFYPVGLKGKKKISDWFNDVKLNEEEKINTLLLMHQEDVIAIIGHRVDKRFVVNTNTKLMMQISWKTKI